MDILKSISVDEIRRRGSIRDSDVARLRAAYDEAAIFSVDDAEGWHQLAAGMDRNRELAAGRFRDVLREYFCGTVDGVEGLREA